jgi:hypothetical protein
MIPLLHPTTASHSNRIAIRITVFWGELSR